MPKWTREQIDTIINRFGEIARPIVRQRFRQDSCIGSTAICMGVMRAFDLVAYPLPVDVTAYNPPMKKRIDLLNHVPQTLEERDQWHSEDGSWAVGAGQRGDDGDVWKGHLITIVDNRVLVDATVDQFATYRMKWPELTDCKGVAFVVTDAFLYYRESDGIQYGGGALVYRAEPENIGYRTAADWRKKNRHEWAIRQIVANIGKTHRRN